MSGSTGSRQRAGRRLGAQRTLTVYGALGVTAGLAITGIAVSGTAHAATTKLGYTCSAPAIGLTFSDPWSVNVRADYPATAQPGASFAGAHLDASVTAGDDAATQFRAIGVSSWSGSVQFSYAVSGAVASPGDRSSTLTVPTTTLPATGPAILAAAGATAGEHAATTPGTATVTAGDFTASLITESGVPVEIDCALVAGQDATIASVQVTAASASPSTSPSSSPSSTGTSPTTGPPIITDGGASGGSDTGVLIGAGVAAAGVVVIGAGAARRLRMARK